MHSHTQIHTHDHTYTHVHPIVTQSIHLQVNWEDIINQQAEAVAEGPVEEIIGTRIPQSFL